MSEYPAALRFDLTVDTPLRKQVLVTAKIMGLTVVPVDWRCFDVWVRSAEEAYQFGARSMVPCAYAAPDDVEPPRVIRTRAIQLED